MFLTGGAVGAVSPRFAVLTRGAVEPFIATALAGPLSSIVTLAMTGAPAANISRAFKALVAVVAGATGMVLQKSSSAPVLVHNVNSPCTAWQ